MIGNFGPLLWRYVYYLPSRGSLWHIGGTPKYIREQQARWDDEAARQRQAIDRANAKMAERNPTQQEQIRVSQAKSEAINDGALDHTGGIYSGHPGSYITGASVAGREPWSGKGFWEQDSVSPTDEQPKLDARLPHISESPSSVGSGRKVKGVTVVVILAALIGFGALASKSEGSGAQRSL